MTKACALVQPVGARLPTMDGTRLAPTTPWRGAGPEGSISRYASRLGEGDGGLSNARGHGVAEDDGCCRAGGAADRWWRRPPQRLRQRWRGPATECSSAKINLVSSCVRILLLDPFLLIPLFSLGTLVEQC
jgi:hypothetical protein